MYKAKIEILKEVTFCWLPHSFFFSKAISFFNKTTQTDAEASVELKKEFLPSQKLSNRSLEALI